MSLLLPPATKSGSTGVLLFARSKTIAIFGAKLDAPPPGRSPLVTARERLARDADNSRGGVLRAKLPAPCKTLRRLRPRRPLQQIHWGRGALGARGAVLVECVRIMHSLYAIRWPNFYKNPARRGDVIGAHGAEGFWNALPVRWR